MANYDSAYTGTQIDTAVGATSGIASNTTHRTSDGSDHTFIDQSVVSGATPTLTGTNLTGIPDTGLVSNATVVSAGEGDSGKLVKLDGAGHVDASAINDGDIDHVNIANKGTNTHAQIDTAVTNSVNHIADTANPHSVDEGDILPTQVAQSGKYLTTNGTVSSWSAVAGGGDMSVATYDVANVSEQLVGLTASQTLTNKTIDGDTNTIQDLAITTLKSGVVETTLTDSDTNLASSGGVFDHVAGATLNNQTGTSYTLVLTDRGKVVTLTNASAITLTIPANASVAFPVGTQIVFAQLGAGQVTFAITSDTLSSASSATKLTGQYSTACIVKVTSTVWILAGDITT